MGKMKTSQIDLRTVSSEQALELAQWPCRDCGEVGRMCECDQHDPEDDEDLEEVYGY